MRLRLESSGYKKKKLVILHIGILERRCSVILFCAARWSNADHSFHTLYSVLSCLFDRRIANSKNCSNFSEILVQLNLRKRICFVSSFTD